MDSKQRTVLILLQFLILQFSVPVVNSSGLWENDMPTYLFVLYFNKVNN